MAKKQGDDGGSIEDYESTEDYDQYELDENPKGNG